MSLVVAIKKDGVVYMGADSHSRSGNKKIILTNQNNYKLFKVRGIDNCLMGHVGAYKHANAIRFIDKLVDDGVIDYFNVVNQVVPTIVNKIREISYANDNKDYHIDSSFLLACKDKLFFINDDKSVVEVDDFFAIGSGGNVALGSLYTTRDNDNVEERILMALKAANRHTVYVGYPFILTNTKDETIKVIEDEREAQYAI